MDMNLPDNDDDNKNIKVVRAGYDNQLGGDNSYVKKFQEVLELENDS